MSLGWSLSNLPFVGEDAAILRRAFGDAQRHLSWPFVGMRRETALTVGGGDTVITWPVTISDESGLHRGAGQLQTPSDFQHWFVFGACATRMTSNPSGGGIVTWAINGNPHFPWADNEASGGTLRIQCPIFALAEAGDIFTAVYNKSDTATVNVAEAWLVFIPLQ